jgi:hypothetical protein
VEQFRSNKFERPFFNYDMEISQNEWYATFLLPTLKAKISEVLVSGKKPDLTNYTIRNLKKIKYHINDLSSLTGMVPGSWEKDLNYDAFNEYTANEAKAFIDSLNGRFRGKIRTVTNLRNSLYLKISSELTEEKFVRIREQNYNEYLADIVKNNMTKNKIYDAGDRFIQKADPIFMKPGSKFGRAQFYAPFKLLGTMKIDTLIFNVAVIWLMVIVLFVTLYYNILKRFIAFLESLKLPILRKYGRELLQI